MKKVLFLILLFMFMFVGCAKPGTENPGGNDEQNPGGEETPGGEENPGGEETPTIDYLKVSEVTDSIDIMYDDFDNLNMIREATRKEVERIQGLYDALTEAEKAEVYNYDLFEEIKTLYDIYMAEKEAEAAEKQKVEAAIAEAKDYLNEVVPKSAGTKNLELPTYYDASNGVSLFIGWRSDDQYTISPTGVITQPRGEAARVTLTATMRSGSISGTFEKQIRVGALQYKKLPAKPVFAYYYTDQGALNEIERDTIDVINLSFGGISDGGDVYVSGLNYETILAERKHGIRVTFSVQSKEGFKKWTATAANREKLSSSFVEVVEKYHFDGVDIDWEFPETGAEVNNYVDFMRLLYTKMKNANPEYLVTAAMFGGQGASKYNAGVSHQYMDYIHLMTYDLNSSEISSHLTCLSDCINYTSVEETVIHYKNQGIPSEKLVIGAAFYGKTYYLSTTSRGFYRVKPIREPSTIYYRTIKHDYLKYLDNPSETVEVTRVWDKDAEAPYLCVYEYNSDKTVKNKIFITYDDVESVTLKSQYVIDQELGGIMFWELGYEDRENSELVKAIHDVLD